MDTLIFEIIVLIIKINNFWGDVSNISTKKAPLIAMAMALILLLKYLIFLTDIPKAAFTRLEARLCDIHSIDLSREELGDVIN